jgi:hypothetical protein
MEVSGGIPVGRINVVEHLRPVVAGDDGDGSVVLDLDAPEPASDSVEVAEVNELSRRR